MILTRAAFEVVVNRITDQYVFPDKGEETVRALRSSFEAGDLDALDGPALCEKVTALFFDLCADKHLRLLWNEEPQEIGTDDGGDDTSEAAFAAHALAQNQGIRRVERLEGNIGLLDLTLIPEPGTGATAIAAAMELVRGTEALIIDLRGNRGGSPSGVQLWCSYFFPDAEVHLNDIYHRPSGLTRQFWTLPHVIGSRYLGRPVYVLTGAVTFSGAEELAYNLKATKRATLVGATTRGGAHPTEWYQITPHLTVTVPNARSINPITGTNWEGVGIEPDLAVPEDDAFDVAYRRALDKASPEYAALD